MNLLPKYGYIRREAESGGTMADRFCFYVYERAEEESGRIFQDRIEQGKDFERNQKEDRAGRKLGVQVERREF